METPPIVTTWYLDKTLWLTLFGFIFPILNKKFGLALDAEEVAAILLPLVVYVVSSKWKQASTMNTSIKANAMVSAGAQKSAAMVAPSPQ